MDFDEQFEAVMKKSEEWGMGFKKSRFYKELPKKYRKEAEWIIERYTDFMFGYYDRLPGKWTQADTIDVISYYFPKKISSDEAFFKSVVPVLTQFFYYLASERLIKNESTLIRGLQKAEPALFENISDPAMWGPAKQLVMSAEEFGVDLSNQDELDAFVAMLNQQSGAAQKFEEEKKKLNRPPFTVTKIGRNDPCPCGSGKKYKKCHGLDGKIIDFPEK